MTGIGPGDPPGPSDAEIIAGSRNDPEQFAVLFDRHAPAIHRYLTRRLGPDFADDLTAETFLAAFARRRDYDVGYPNAAPWLYGIATRLAGQHHRQEARRLRALRALDPQRDEPGYEDRVAADLTARALGGRLAAALAGLPQGQRDVLLLIAWEQLSYDDAARVLGIPTGTVRSRLNRARALLRPVLADTSLATTIEEILK